MNFNLDEKGGYTNTQLKNMRIARTFQARLGAYLHSDVHYLIPPSEKAELEQLHQLLHPSVLTGADLPDHRFLSLGVLSSRYRGLKRRIVLKLVQ